MSNGVSARKGSLPLQQHVTAVLFDTVICLSYSNEAQNKIMVKSTVVMRDFKVLTAVMLKGCGAMLSATNFPTSGKNLLSPGSSNSQGRHFPVVGVPRLVFLHLLCRSLK